MNTSNCLFFSYDGLLDPLGSTQILPYILYLGRTCRNFTIISYEKQDRTDHEIAELKRELSKSNISWLPLIFEHKRFGFIWRIVSGVLALRKVAKGRQIELVHLRGFQSATIYKLSGLKVPYIYDFRGFALRELVDIGKLRQHTPLFKLLSSIDKSNIENAAGIVVLENAARELLDELYAIRGKPLKVIRTSTDVARYCKPKPGREGRGRSLLLVFLGGARRPYRPDLAFRLLNVLRSNDIHATIDFINERDHFEIHAAADRAGVSKSDYSVLRAEPKDVPNAISKYDYGLIFLDSSKWRRVCSPTKFGEYLAAGLSVISSPGIDVVDEFARNTRCVHIFDGLNFVPPSELDVSDIDSFIFHANQYSTECQAIAEQHFNLKMASAEYEDLYREISRTL